MLTPSTGWPVCESNTSPLGIDRRARRNAVGRIARIDVARAERRIAGHLQRAVARRRRAGARSADSPRRLRSPASFRSSAAFRDRRSVGPRSVRPRCHVRSRHGSDRDRRAARTAARRRDSSQWSPSAIGCVGSIVWPPISTGFGSVWKEVPARHWVGPAGSVTTGLLLLGRSSSIAAREAARLDDRDDFIAEERPCRPTTGRVGRLPGIANRRSWRRSGW